MEACMRSAVLAMISLSAVPLVGWSTGIATAGPAIPPIAAAAAERAVTPVHYYRYRDCCGYRRHSARRIVRRYYANGCCAPRVYYAPRVVRRYYAPVYYEPRVYYRPVVRYVPVVKYAPTVYYQQPLDYGYYGQAFRYNYIGSYNHHFNAYYGGGYGYAGWW
jgi:hypothetical protein